MDINGATEEEDQTKNGSEKKGKCRMSDELNSFLEKERQGELIIEANEQIIKEFEDKRLRDRFQLIEENWFSSTLSLEYLKHVLTLLVFYKFMFLFVTRYLYLCQRPYLS